MNNKNKFQMYYEEFASHLEKLTKALTEKNMNLFSKAELLPNILKDLIKTEIEKDMKFKDDFSALITKATNAVEIQNENELQNRIIELITNIMQKKIKNLKNKLENIDEFKVLLGENQEDLELVIEDIDISNLTLVLQNQKYSLEEEFLKFKKSIVNNVFQDNYLSSDLDKPRNNICNNLTNFFAFEINLKKISYEFQNNNLIQCYTGNYQAKLILDQEKTIRFLRAIASSQEILEFDLRPNFSNQEFHITNLHSCVSFRDHKLQSQYFHISSQNIPETEMQLELKKFFMSLTQFELAFRISNNVGRALLERKGLNLIEFAYREDIKVKILKPMWSISSDIAQKGKIRVNLNVDYNELILEEIAALILIKFDIPIEGSLFRILECKCNNFEAISNLESGSFEFSTSELNGIFNAEFTLTALDINLFIENNVDYCSTAINLIKFKSHLNEEISANYPNLVELIENLYPNIYCYCFIDICYHIYSNIEIESLTDDYRIDVLIAGQEDEEEPNKSQVNVSAQSSIHSIISKIEKELPPEQLEYMELCQQEKKKGCSFSKSEGLKTKNNSKNRHRDIIPYDHNRVKLKNTETDYINASLIEMNSKCYIATQDPLNNTVEDFWQMIIQYKSRCIVTTSTKYDMKQESYVKYWPDEVNKQIDIKQIQIKFLSKEIHDDFIVQSYQIANRSIQREIKQFQYLRWNNKSIPEDLKQYALFLKTLNKYVETLKKDYPITVHCNSGISRSALVICSDLIYNQIFNTKSEIDIKNLVREIRTKKESMIQNLEQYKYLHALKSELKELIN